MATPSLEDQIKAIGGGADGVHRLLGREQARLAQKAINKRDFAKAKECLETALGHVECLIQNGKKFEQKAAGFDDLPDAGESDEQAG